MTADDDPYYYYEIQLTPEGYNQYADSPIFHIRNNFKHELHSLNLSQEDKDELVNLITQLINEKQLSKDNESKLKKFSGKVGTTVVTETIVAFLKAFFHS